VRFGSTPLAEAEGAILAHAHRAGDRVFKKGRVLSSDDVAALDAAGVAEVIAARLEANDVGEDAAADRVAAACLGPGLSATAPFTGRCNLYAERDGVVVVDRDRLDALNLVDEAVTVATLAPFARVAPRQMVATIKVIPFAAPEGVVAQCEALARDGGPLIRVAPFRGRAVALVQTRLPGTKVAMLDKTTEVTRARLEALGCTLADERRCEHSIEALAATLEELRDGGLILINGASAIVDRRDVIPAAIEAAGGTVVHYGMPVDPGNLILTGALGDAPVLGLPGCARSPRLNGFDWVLERLVADLEVTPREIMAMGTGGLLKEIASRPLPRGQAEAAPAEVPAAPRVAALVLAAGQSRRMGAINKLLADIDGVPMVAHAVDAALASQAASVVVVTGHEQARVAAALGDRNVTVVHNPDYAAGLSTSLRAGLAAVPADCQAVAICLGDMPRIAARHLDRLIAAYDPLEGRAICVPTWRGKRGNPVLFDRRFFAEMTDVEGDTGARHLIGEHGEVVAEVAMDDDAVLLDVDEPEALRALAGE